MRTGRVKVRRGRPGAVSWAIALAVTMLMVYLITLDAGPKEESVVSALPAGERVTKEVTLAPLELHCVQFGSFADASNARIEAARYVERGAAGYVYEDDGSFRVLGAGYRQKADAERVAGRLHEDEGIECVVLSRTAEEVKMRITAGENQIEAILAADEARRTQTEQFGELAFQIDRGELTGDAARTLMAVQASQVRDVREALKAIPGENAVFTGLTRQVELLAATLELLSYKNTETDLSLSGKIKYNYISTRLGYIDFLRSLQ